MFLLTRVMDLEISGRGKLRLPRAELPKKTHLQYIDFWYDNLDMTSLQAPILMPKCTMIEEPNRDGLGYLDFSEVNDLSLHFDYLKESESNRLKEDYQAIWIIAH